jgi:hypothetical protein
MLCKYNTNYFCLCYTNCTATSAATHSLEVSMFIITSVAQQGEYANETLYFAIDRPAGNCPYWAHWINRAEIFASEKEATDVMQKEVNAKRNVTLSGSYPNYLVHYALGLDSGIMRGTAKICVQEITLTQKTVMMVSDYIAK